MSEFLQRHIKDLKSKVYHYNGKFSFLLSLQKQYKKDFRLTDKQWTAAYRCFYGKDSAK